MRQGTSQPIQFETGHNVSLATSHEMHESIQSLAVSVMIVTAMLSPHRLEQ